MVHGRAKPRLLQGFGAWTVGPASLHHGPWAHWETRSNQATRLSRSHCPRTAVHALEVAAVTAIAMAASTDVQMVDVSVKAQDTGDYADLLQTNHADAFAFSEAEMLALQLFDQLHELELEHSLLQAQQSGTSSVSSRSLRTCGTDFWCAASARDIAQISDDELQDQLTIAQREAMEARAEYELRNRITHNVLVMDPVLKAVHGGELTTGSAEKCVVSTYFCILMLTLLRRLSPMITENDALSLIQGTQAAKLAANRRAFSEAEKENIIINQKNRELSKTMLALAEEMKAQSAKDIEDPQLRDQVNGVEKELKQSRRRVKTLRGILSAMIVGSGINWAADEALTELVLDDDEDD